MTAETDLLPLPWIERYAVVGDIAYPVSSDPDGDYVAHDDHAAAMHDYARACVSSATEALRVEVESERRLRIREEGLSRAWKARTDFAEKGLNECAGRAARAEHRAARLAEALRFARTRFAQYMDDTDRAAFDAALDQETTNG